jgi:hypothetical protein
MWWIAFTYLLFEIFKFYNDCQQRTNQYIENVDRLGYRVVVTDVSRQLSGPISKGQTFQEDGNDNLPSNDGNQEPIYAA